MPPFHLTILYPFMQPYIIDCMYTHVIFNLVLKVAKTTKKLIRVLLFIPLRRSDKQDRISQFLNLLLYHAYGLAFSMEDCALCVVCWVVTTRLRPGLGFRANWMIKPDSHCAVDTCTLQYGHL